MVASQMLTVPSSVRAPGTGTGHGVASVASAGVVGCRDRLEKSAWCVDRARDRIDLGVCRLEAGAGFDPDVRDGDG